MSSILDPAKLKVVELRSELSARNLDTKGNKAALVKRLKDALDEEAAAGGDTSCNIDNSEVEEADSGETEDVAEESEAPPDKEAPEEVPEKMETDNSEKEKEPEPQPEESVEENAGEPQEEKEEPKPEENGDKAEKDDVENDAEEADNKDQSEEAKTDEPEKRGEKRRRSSPSPERQHQRRRSKTPIKEDEPIIDNDKVQLSWYDSDLHLQLDKESFLSAKPFNEGAFAYAWAGVRTNYGVPSGKACFEVKVTEELKWEDFSFQKDRNKRDAYKIDNRKSTSPKKTTKEESDTQETKAEEIKKEPEEGVEVKMEADADVEAKKEPEDDEKQTEENTANGDAKKEESEIKKEKPEDEKMEEDTPVEESAEKSEKKDEPAAEAIPTHLIRVGWSIIESGFLLGENKFSYGYESSGKFVTDKNFEDYGIKYGVGDVVGAYLNIDEEVVITFTVNGVAQPNAITIPRSDLPENFVFFPHVATRNYGFEVNVGNQEEPWFPSPAELDGYTFISNIEDKVPGPQRPIDRSECEIILMCGLPACGKTHWVREHLKENPDKRYLVIGNTQLLEKMTVCGKPLKSAFKGRWSLLMDRLQKSLNKLLEFASQRRRNYIIDQTNVFPSAQRRKLRPFEGFKRQAVVIVVSDEEQAKRQKLQEAQDGKEVPDSTILEMKAIMSLPQKGEWLDEVKFVELDEAASKEMVEKYNKDGKAAGYGTGHKRIPRREDSRWNKRHDMRYGNYRDKGYQNRYDHRTPHRPSWNNRPSGNWNRDRRDSGRHSVGGPRDWRPRDSRPNDRGSRDMSRHSSSYRSHGGNSRSSSGWQAYPQSAGQGWNQQTFGHHNSWGGQGAQSWGQNQWKYGGGPSQGYGNYGNYNYYGQYAQNWGQGQTGSTTAASGTTQYSTTGQQQDYSQSWSQYYGQGQQNSTSGSHGY